MVVDGGVCIACVYGKGKEGEEVQSKEKGMFVFVETELKREIRVRGSRRRGSSSI